MSPAGVFSKAVSPDNWWPPRMSNLSINSTLFAGSDRLLGPLSGGECFHGQCVHFVGLHAPAHRGVDLLVTLNTRLTLLYATAGLPALTVPAGYAPNGQPVGLTFVGDRMEDPELIGAAYAFEQAAERRKRPAEMNSILSTIPS